MDDERWAKMPRWARDDYNQLKSENRRLRRQVYPEGEAWCFLPSGGEPVPLAFGKSSYDTIRLQRGVDSRDYFYIKLSEDGRSIHVNSSEALMIKPNVTNSVDIFLARD